MKITWYDIIFLIFIKLLNDKKDFDDFLIWAFGDDCIYLMPYQLVDRWNIYHGDKYQITLVTDVEESSKIMIDMWRNYK